MKFFLVFVTFATSVSLCFVFGNSIGQMCSDEFANMFQMEEVRDVRQLRTDNFSFKKVGRDVFFNVSLQYVFSVTTVGSVVYICGVLLFYLIRGGD